MVKLPLPPKPAALKFRPDDLRLVPTDTVLWRVHRTSGDHVVAWRGVSYAALSIPTAFAEVFQHTRVINTQRDAPYLTAWSPARPLTLLDLTGSWPIRAGASYAINAGRRDHCRAWARAIHTARPDLDGLWHHSSMTGGDSVTLFTPSADSFPSRPQLSLPLSHPGLRGHIHAAAAQIDYRIL